MKNIVKKTAIALALVCFIASLFSYCAAAQVSTEYFSDQLLADFTSTMPSTTNLDIKARSVILMEPKTGQVLYETNADEKLAPASITKIMSLLLVMEAIENEKISLSTMAQTSDHAASMGGSQIWLEPGEEMTVDQLLRAAVIASANDATVALAELVAGSEETFVEQMNQRAKELGMSNTNFVNACGLDTEGHITTARDVAIMSSALIKHSLIKKYSTVWMDALRDGKSELVNTNKLVRYYSGCTGLKTGTTSNAGCCVSATAERNGMELVAVVMKGENSNERFAGAKKLLDYGFANWSFVSIKADSLEKIKIPVSKGVRKNLTVEATESFQFLLKKGAEEKIEKKAEFFKDITAPVLKGDKVGEVKLFSEGKQIGAIPITSAEQVDKISFFNSFLSMLGAALCP